MPIQRTTMIDDDGTGTTGTILNNAWLQTIYGQIDTLVGPVTAWTPTDASGAGLAFDIATGWYQVTGTLVTFFARVIYPPTSTAHVALIGGLPIPNGPAAFAGAFPTLASLPLVVHLPTGIATFSMLNTSGQSYTNAQLSSGQFIFQGAYFKA